MQWYYVKGEQQVGPIEVQELVDLIKRGEVQPADLVWNESMGDQWAEASVMLPALFPAGAVSKVSRGEGVPNAELMAQARGALAGHWGSAVGICVLWFVVSMVVNQLPDHSSAIVSLLITGPFSLGLSLFFLTLGRRGNPSVSQIVQGFQRFGTATGAYLLMLIFIVLWGLLLIIPGILAAYAYSMTFFLLVDDPSLGPMEAITRSKEMMRGAKWRLFCLHCRFIGWSLLALLTLGIGFLWVWPYIMTSQARFYDDLREDLEAGEVIVES